jgi:molybdopterin converting factor small subunit
MRVRVTAFGHLREHFGNDAHDVTLAEGSTLQDLLLLWEEQWHERMPASLWNRDEHRFRGPVVIRVADRVVRDRSTALTDGANVHLYQALVGG